MCVCVCVRACVRACVRVCVCVCVRARARLLALRIVSMDKSLRFTNTLIIITKTVVPYSARATSLSDRLGISPCGDPVLLIAETHHTDPAYNGVTCSFYNRRSSEIQGTVFGKCLRAWSCIYKGPCVRV